MPKGRTRAPGAPLKPPGKWSERATIDFYERHDGSVDKMADVIATWERSPIKDPYSFAAQIADFVRQTTEWRAIQKELWPDYCVECGTRSDEAKLIEWKRKIYCHKCYVILRYQN